MKNTLLKIRHKIKWLFPWIKQPVMYAKQALKYYKSKRRVFIDCGANTGKVLEEFILKMKGFEFHAFEPQPELALTGKKITELYPDLPFKYYKEAVWIKDTELNFYLATQWGPNYKGGSTMMQGHTKNQTEIDYGNPVKVKAIDFSAWVKRSFMPDDYIIIKMDIEGAEYDVLEKMIKDNSLEYINELIIEFHNNMNDQISDARHNRLVKAIKKRLILILWY
nr:FkbM family methyltransferase [Bacteroidota bacterium]